MNQQYCYWPGRSFCSFADLAKLADCSDYVVDCSIPCDGRLLCYMLFEMLLLVRLIQLKVVSY